MRIRLFTHASRLVIVGAMLFAFAGHALIPQGFMPASGHPFSVEICPEDFPAQLLMHAGHHHHGGGHARTEHCVFGCACNGAPPPQHLLLTELLSAQQAPAAQYVASTIVVRLVYLPHSRGPPSLA